MEAQMTQAISPTQAAKLSNSKLGKKKKAKKVKKKTKKPKKKKTY